MKYGDDHNKSMSKFYFVNTAPKKEGSIYTPQRK